MASMDKRIGAAQAVGLPLIEVEKHLDAAFALLAKVQVAAVEGRQAARLPLDAGHEAIDRIITAQQSLHASRQAVHAAHYGFRAIADAMGVPVRAYGDHGDTPREGGDGVIPTMPGAHLAVVQADAA